MSFVLNYEEGSENSILDGDPHGETVGESPSPVALGERDLANESFFEYGSRVGVWRILDMFDEYGVDATIYACALALERNPEVGREIVRRGHEVMGHGNRWEEYYKMDPGRGTAGHPRGRGIHRAFLWGAAAGLVHPIRPQRQHP